MLRRAGSTSSRPGSSESTRSARLTASWKAIKPAARWSLVTADRRTEPRTPRQARAVTELGVRMPARVTSRQYARSALGVRYRWPRDGLAGSLRRPKAGLRAVVDEQDALLLELLRHRWIVLVVD